MLIADHPRIAQSLFNLAMLYEEMNRVDDAVSLLQQSLDAEDRLLANVFKVSSEDERLGDSKRLFVAPDGLLNELPFEVLPWMMAGGSVPPR